MTAGKKPDFEVDTSGVNDLYGGLADRFGKDEAKGPKPGDGTTARRQDGTTAGNRSKYTILLDESEALGFDELAMTLRRMTGRRVDKAEIMRALLTMAQHDRDTTQALAERLRRNAA